MSDTNVLLGRVLGHVEALRGDLSAFRMETVTHFEAIETKIAIHADELAEQRGGRRERARRGWKLLKGIGLATGVVGLITAVYKLAALVL